MYLRMRCYAWCVTTPCVWGLVKCNCALAPVWVCMCMASLWQDGFLVCAPPSFGVFVWLLAGDPFLVLFISSGCLNTLGNFTVQV